MAKKAGLVIRYWDVPSWTVNYRDYIWSKLREQGVSLLSVDEIYQVSQSWLDGYLVSVCSILVLLAACVIVSFVVVWWRNHVRRTKGETFRKANTSLRNRSRFYI